MSPNRDTYQDPEQYGNVNSQIKLVAEQLSSIPELKDGFDAIGLSQGQSCNFHLPALLIPP